MQALDADEQPLAALSLMCIADDGRPLQSRLLDEQHLASVTDASGRARFDALPPGRYDVTLGGAVSKAKVTVTDRPLSRTLRLPRRTVHVGLVTDPFGRPVADAEVWVTETAGRADLPAVVARTDAGGAYRLDHPLNDALVFARHADYSQSASARLTRGTERRLTLEPPTPSVSVTVVDGAGAVVAGALCAVVPRSQSTTFYAPLLARTDTDGRASVPGPGRRQAALLVQHPDFAPQTRPLEGSDQTLLLTLLPPKVVTGTARASDGAPLAGREVIASVAGDRTNEPTGPLFARRAVVGADGTFRIAGAPSAILQVRIVNSAPRHEGPPLAAYVAAGVDLDTRTGERFSVDLIEPQTDTIRGTLTTPDGRALAAHHIVAVPSVGVAGHRLFRRRIAHTDASGAFELPAVAAGETYEIAVFPPRRWWPNPQSWPIAFATARAEQACDIVVASADEPTASLSCQALLPDGRPASDAVYELRHLAYQTPLTRPADKSGRTTFQLLTAGDYWLSVYVKGVGNKTIPVHIEPNQPHDLAALQLEAPSELVVVLVGPSAGLGAGARVVARNLVGDKFVASQAAGDGVAKLRPLPPGPSQLLVYGPSIAPVLIDRDLAPGQQWLDVAVAPANPVRIRFPFALADNPFVINGPLHVRVYDDDERIVLEDYLGTTTDRGRFTIEFGLPSGRYRVVARSIWNACAEAQLDVVAGQTTDTTIRLER